VFLQLVFSSWLGFRSLSEQVYYRRDPMKRLLGLNELPDAATLSRPAASAGG